MVLTGVGRCDKLQPHTFAEGIGTFRAFVQYARRCSNGTSQMSTVYEDYALGNVYESHQRMCNLLARNDKEYSL
jgi:hypothetical protein